MVLFSLHNSQIQSSFGGKINRLIELIQAGYLVPEGVVVPIEVVRKIEATGVTADLEEEIKQLLKPNQVYIVRSSATIEDGEISSFAGQFDSIEDCRGIEGVITGIELCLHSIEAERLRQYSDQQGVSFQEESQLALLIQEQVEADLSGVAFSLAPMAQKDTQAYMEYVKGQANALMSGLESPYCLAFDWYEEAVDLSQQLITKVEFEKVRQALIGLAEQYGYPVDIEFCLRQQQLFLVQVRPITRVNNQVDGDDQWTNANYRDGGVASQVCPRLMASLYDRVWTESLGNYLRQNQLVPEHLIGPLMLYRFGRPYWNLATVKFAMAQIPGYVEQEFDDELGVTKFYEGQGHVTDWSFKGLGHLLKVARLINRHTQETKRQLETRRADLIHKFESYQVQLDNNLTLSEVETIWSQLIEVDAFQAEQTYFTQVFINTVQLSLKKNFLLRFLSKEEFFNQIAGIGQLSHLKPIVWLQEAMAELREDDSRWQAWLKRDEVALLEKIQAHPDCLESQILRAFQEKFGYHSSRELQLLVPSYSEDPLGVVYIMKATAQQMNEGVAQVAPGKNQLPYYKKWLDKPIRELRLLLWWREEFKDISSRYYHLVRQWTLKLGQAYQIQGYIEQVEDLFYVKQVDILAVIEGQTSPQHLQNEVDKGHQLTQAYRNFTPPNDLNVGQIQPFAINKAYLEGMPAHNGQVRGRVRVLDSPQELKLVQAGEILVAKYTDTGWSFVFGKIAGLVTQYGGVLCHASIVAREYDLPTIVCVPDVTERLKTGMLVEMDATQGRIRIVEEETK